MRLIWSIIFTCLCLQQTVAQTGLLPDWVANPKDGEYVGCSFPSEDVHSRHETALLCALLNYVVCNINLGGPVRMEGEYSYSGSGLAGLDTSVVERNHAIMLNYQIIRLEAKGNDTYVSVKVDDKGDPKDGVIIKYLQKVISSGLEEKTVSIMTEKIDLKLSPYKKYEINTHGYFSDTKNEQSILLYGETIRNLLKIEGQAIEGGSYEIPEGQNNGIVGVKTLPFYRYCGDISKNGVGGAFWQSVLQRLSEKVIGLDQIYDSEEDGDELDWHHFRNTNEISGKNLYVMFKSKKKTSKKQ